MKPKESSSPDTQSPSSQQIALDLPVEQSVTREDLVESPANRMAIDLVDGWPDWPSTVVILAGPVGSGKTHIASVWAREAGAAVMAMKDLPDRIRDLDESVSLVLEDASAGGIDEEALFHAFNRARLHGGFILITSREFPGAWGLELADLKSRLSLAQVVELSEPDDELLAAVIVKLFADRQVQIDPAVVTYLVNRMERSLGTAGELVEWLDREGMARRKKITRQLAGEALAAFEKP